MREELTLYDAIEQILEKIEGKLISEIRPGGYLDGVAMVLTGDRDRNITYPFVMIEPDIATPATTTIGLVTDWELPIGLTGFVKNSDPKVGRKEARILAGKARSAVLKKWTGAVYIADRGLDLAFVNAVDDGAFGGAGRLKEDGAVFITVAFVTVKFRTRE